MAASIVERYERILRADPKSRVFVELARAFLERGEPQRAIELCERGIEHHPDSVVARVVWGKALLAVGRVDDAVHRFDEATALEPQNPYAYDLAGEALVRGGHPDRARALLERGAATHPHDGRIQLWLAEANASGPDGTAQQRAIPGGRDGPEHADPGAPEPSASHVASARAPGGPESAAGPGPERPPPLTPSPEAAPGPPPVPTAAERATSGPSRGSLADVLALLPDDSGAAPRSSATTPEAAAVVVPPAAAPRDATRSTGGGDATEVAPPGAAEQGATEPPANGAGPPLDAQAGPHTAGEDQGAPPHAPPEVAPPVSVVAETAATTNGQAEIGKEVTAQAPPRGSLRRHARAILVVTLLAAALAGAATFLIVKARHRESDAHAAAEAAKKGLARDTLGSLREAQRVLVRARGAAPTNADVASTLAEVAAVLAHDFDDAEARTTARSLVESSIAGPGTFAARWLLATTPRDRDAAAIALLERRDATPLASAIAGEVLLSRHENGAARAALEAAGRASPPLLRAVTRVGDLDAANGDPAAALERYRAVLRAQPTHPRAAIGAGEVSLALGRDLDVALRAIEAVAGDAQSAPPVGDRARFTVVRARLLAAAGRGPEAIRLLDAAAGQLGGRADAASARAEALASTSDVAGALAAAEAARRAAPGEARYREQVAQLQLRLARYRDLLAGSESDPSRAVRTCRGIARIELGDATGARAELEATRRDGKMTPEAAAWMAIAEIASGRLAHAASLVDTLLAAPAPHPVALLARARLDIAAGRQDAAEQRLRDAIDRDPDLLDARYELGRLLLERGRAEEARDVLEKAVARAPWRASARVALARARLATGEREAAIHELEAVASERPEDPGALDGARRLLRAVNRR